MRYIVKTKVIVDVVTIVDAWSISEAEAEAKDRELSVCTFCSSFGGHIPDDQFVVDDEGFNSVYGPCEASPEYAYEEEEEDDE